MEEQASKGQYDECQGIDLPTVWSASSVQLEDFRGSSKLLAGEAALLFFYTKSRIVSRSRLTGCQKGVCLLLESSSVGYLTSKATVSRFHG